MDIGLVPDIPNQLVTRRVKDVMEPYGQLDDPEACAEVTPGYRNCADRLLAKLIRNPLKLVGVQLTQVGGSSQGVKKRPSLEGRQGTGCCHSELTLY